MTTPSNADRAVAAVRAMTPREVHDALTLRFDPEWHSEIARWSARDRRDALIPLLAAEVAS